MVKVALIGAGKMGISHLSILGAHPNAEVTGVCDTSSLITDFLTKVSGYDCFSDYKKMIEKINPDAVFVAVPTKFHYEIIKYLLEKDIHVFAEKPFTLYPEQSYELAHLASSKSLVTQVGYHNKFIGTFIELKEIITHNLIGNIYHFIGEAYGPVITKKKAGNWRSNPEEGGGCLLDYASHVIDLINDIISPITKVYSTILKPIFSEQVEDAVYSTLQVASGVTGILSVNWSDDTYRKMSTSITVNGTKGKIICDATEIKIFFKEDPHYKEYTKGWNVQSVAALQAPVDFYLRGEEYSTQVNYFIDAIENKTPSSINNFESAAKTDMAIDLIRKNGIA
jgi:predicted dehydrogenase